MREAARNLPNVHVVAARAETVANEVDWVLSRAVKWSDIAQVLKRLGKNAELLSGELRAEELSGFVWCAPIAMPWGDRRYLWIGSRSES